MKPQRICIIGGSGFVGGYVAERLTRDDVELTVVTRRRERHKALIVLPRLTLMETDVNEPGVLSRLIAGHDAVISMVGRLHGSRADFQQAHVRLVENIITACQHHGVRRLVHISALGAAESAPSDYQQTKGMAETRLRQSALDWTILRPSVIFGAGDSFLTMFACLARCLPLIPLAGADTRFAPIWADDVARAVAACLANDATIGQSLDLAGPRVYTLRELVSYVSRITGHPRSVVALPQGLAMIQAALMELVPGPKLLSRDNVRSLSVDNVSANPFPRDFLGFSPTALEAVAPSYLGSREFNAVMDRYREHAVGRRH